MSKEGKNEERMKGRINERRMKKNKEGENKLRKETWKRIWQHESRFTSNKTLFFL